MTYWLDAHLDPTLAPWLGVTFRIFVKTLRDVGLHEEDDDVIFAAARRFAPVTIITKDSDFVDLIDALGPPPQVVRLGCGNMRTLQLQAWLRSMLADAIGRIEGGEACVVIE